MTETTELVPAGTVLQVDPTTLVLDDNIRTDVRLTDEFLASVTEHRVLVPLHVRQDPLGQLLVIDGQRRLTAALQAGLDAVPVVVVAGIGDDAARITDQWILNEHRAGLTHAERAAAVEQLALFGRSPATIAKKLGASQADVDAALAVAKAPKVLEAIATEPAVDLVTAAKLVEFADDEELLEELTVEAVDDPEGLEHTLERVRRNRNAAAARAEKVAELEAQGQRVLPLDKARTGDALTDLSATARVDGSVPAALTPEEHADCPHRAFAVETYHHSYPGKGIEVSVTERCTDSKAAGHHLRWTTVDTTAAETKAAERKHTTEQNAASDAAQEIRRRFITDHLLWERDAKGRMMKVPAGAVEHVAAVVAQVGMGYSYDARTLLSEWERGKTLPAPGSSRSAAERALLRRVLATGEASLPRDFWRSNHYVGSYMPDGAPVGVLHLRRLQAWGYGLAPVEREYLEAWDAAVVEHNEHEARRAAERAARDAGEQA